MTYTLFDDLDHPMTLTLQRNAEELTEELREERDRRRQDVDQEQTAVQDLSRKLRAIQVRTANRTTDKDK